MDLNCCMWPVAGSHQLPGRRAHGSRRANSVALQSEIRKAVEAQTLPALRAEALSSLAMRLKRFSGMSARTIVTLS